MTLVVTGIIGALLMVAFLGFMATWVKALPLVLIILLVMGLMFYDLYADIRASVRGGN